ncbi:TetR/AcrR family transcriptional regulator [Paracoccus sp. (in: a-proteobacteria)]|uniref:TetR/AcrR family transcriptional regulator n=1 Tax=Paracoccus sp. TaxID=267 RepID=UPI0028A285D6|nr:TetR/AcrR family transcriptional regulator [Paracoccus sp. (in: a-proteobacteria)]
MNEIFSSGEKRSAGQQKAFIHKVCAELFAKHGYGSVGVAELCSAVGLGRGAFYYHVKSKEDILLDISVGYMKRLCAEAEGTVAKNLSVDDAIRELSDHFLRTMFEHRAEMTVCFRELHLLSPENQRTVIDLHRNYEAIWRSVILRGTAEGAFRDIHTIDLKALMGMYFYSFLWAKPQGNATATEIADHFSTLVLEAIRQRN